MPYYNQGKTVLYCSTPMSWPTFRSQSCTQPRLCTVNTVSCADVCILKHTGITTPDALH